MMSLEIEPYFGGPTEVTLQAQGCIRGDSPPSFHNLIDAPRRDADVFCQPVFGQGKREEKVIPQDFAGMDGSVCFHDKFSVVIDDFNLVRAIVFPAETDAPLVVDSDGVLAFAVSFESLQTVAGRDGEVFEIGDSVELGKFPQRNTLDIGRERTGFPFAEQDGGLLAGEGTDHRVRSLNNAWRYVVKLTAFERGLLHAGP